MREGEILSIIGPNGAGKTTIFNVVTGLYRPTAGDVHLRGRPISGLPPHVRARLGVARTFQNIRLFRDLTVGENVRVARYGRARVGTPGALLRTPGFRRERAEADRVGEPPCWTSVGLRGRAASSPGASPTATRSGSSWRGRSPPSRACCCSTSRRPG